MEALRHLSAKWRESEEAKQGSKKAVLDDVEEFEDEEDEEETYVQKKTAINGKRLSIAKKAAPVATKKKPAPKPKPKAAPAKKAKPKTKPATKKKR